MHYSYHNRILQRINDCELTGYEYVDEYNGIKPCLLLYFDTQPVVRPIRQKKWNYYEKLLNI